MPTSPTADDLKRAAAKAAAAIVEDGMTIGLGTGTTAAKLVDELAQRMRGGLKFACVPTSESTRRLAEAAGLKLTTLDDTPHLDLTIDGADEIDPVLTLIKGGGGALLREKIVATASDRMVVIADISKRVPALGAFPLPVEIVPFGATATRNMVAAMVREIGYERLAQGRGRQAVRDRERQSHPRLCIWTDQRAARPCRRPAHHPGRGRARAVHRPC
jgi:ribose 5-phosphate isomerase A